MTRRVPRPIRLARAAALAVALLALAPAAARATCPAEPVTQPYLALGDPGWYFMAPGGDFEAKMEWAATGTWSLETGAGKPLAFGGKWHLRLAQGATATSPGICVDVDRTHLRFGLHAPEGAGRLTVQAVEGSRTTTLAVLDGALHAAWGVSPPVPLATALAVAPGTRRSVRLRLVATGRSWRADAVAVDPRRAG